MSNILLKKPSLCNCEKGLVNITQTEFDNLRNGEISSINVFDSTLNKYISVDAEKVISSIYKIRGYDFYKFNYLLHQSTFPKPTYLNLNQVALKLQVPVENIDDLERFKFLLICGILDGQKYYLEKDVLHVLKNSHVTKWIKSFQQVI